MVLIQSYQLSLSIKIGLIKLITIIIPMELQFMIMIIMFIPILVIPILVIPILVIPTI